MVEEVLAAHAVDAHALGIGQEDLAASACYL